MKVIQLHAVEGNVQRLDGGAMYGNVPKAMWQKWSLPDEFNRINLACRCLLMITDTGRKILFETGIGCFFDPKLKERYGVFEAGHVLIKNLAKLGISPSDISDVVLSHLHFDHAGGLLSEYAAGQKPSLIFDQATYHVGLEHWERAIKPHSRDRASFVQELNDLLEKSGRLRLVHGPQDTELSPLVTFHYSYGHTVGLMLSEIHLDAGPLVFVADLIPGLPWIHLPVTMGYDRAPEQLIDEKKSLLEALVKENGKIFFTHDEHTACAIVKRDEKGRFFGVASSLPVTP